MSCAKLVPVLRVLAYALLLVTAISAAAQQPAAPSPGVLQEQVACKADPTKSYALYLPSAYRPNRTWPVVFAFDPMGRGALPVKLYKDVAEKYGIILAGSNNSRNFSATASQEGVRAMWGDLQERFALDQKRLYTMGFSGGARMAGEVALQCAGCGIAGVIANGAGYPAGLHPKNKSGPAYFLAVGDADFNWPEIVGVRRQREEAGLPYRVEVFHGRHQWAPTEIFEDAVRWMQLKAMQSGRMPKDESFVDAMFRERQNEAADAEKNRDAIAQLAAYRALVSDFGGMKDVSGWQTKLEALKRSRELKEALGKENEQISMQAELTSDINSGLAGLGQASSVADRVNRQQAIVDQIRQLKNDGDHIKTEWKRLVYQRAIAEVRVNLVERGGALFASGDFEKAEMYFAMLADGDNNPQWKVLLAEARTARGDRKGAMQALRDAVHGGLKDAESLENDKDLAGLKSDPDFLRLIAEMKRASSAAKP